MKKIFKFCIWTLLFIAIPAMVTFADPPGPPGPGGNPVGNGGTPVGAPIDSGVLVLLAMGILYGALKLYQHNLGKHRIAEEKE